MPLEIERKFLVKLENWDTDIEGIPYRQGYLAINDKNVVRVRIKGEIATITIKSNEIGLIKIVVEGGIFLAIALLFHIFKYSKYILVFLIVSSLHYTFIVNIPFSLFLILQLNQKISNARLSRIQRWRPATFSQMSMPP